MTKEHCGVDLRSHPRQVWDEATDEWVCSTCGDRKPVKRTRDGYAVGGGPFLRSERGAEGGASG